MRIRGEKITEGEQVLGKSEETEFTFLLVPVKTYELINEVAKKQGRSVARGFSESGFAVSSGLNR